MHHLRRTCWQLAATLVIAIVVQMTITSCCAVTKWSPSSERMRKAGSNLCVAQVECVGSTTLLYEEFEFGWKSGFLHGEPDDHEDDSIRPVEDLPSWATGLQYKLVPGHFNCEQAIGWPARCVFWLGDWRTSPPVTYSTSYVLANCPPVALDASTNPLNGPSPLASLQLPNGIVGLRPIWIGLAFNSAATWSGVCAVLFALHRTRCMWRRHRWQCVSCCYDLKGLSAQQCPECGTLIAKRKTIP